MPAASGVHLEYGMQGRAARVDRGDTSDVVVGCRSHGGATFGEVIVELGDGLLAGGGGGNSGACGRRGNRSAGGDGSGRGRIVHGGGL